MKSVFAYYLSRYVLTKFIGRGGQIIGGWKLTETSAFKFCHASINSPLENSLKSISILNLELFTDRKSVNWSFFWPKGQLPPAVSNASPRQSLEI